MASNKRLIINADDFGIHEAVNRGILRGYTSGCLTSTSIMPTGEAFDQALEMAKDCPGLGVGVHLTLVDERPVESASLISSLLDDEGFFHSHYIEFIKKYLQGNIDLKDVYREMRAQIKKTVESGLKLPLTHLDSHQHLHVLPGIIDLVIALALEFNIRAIRIPNEAFCFHGEYSADFGRLIGRTGLTSLALLARRKIKKAKLLSPENFFGMLAGGNLREEFLLNIIDSLPAGVSEVMIHPGEDDDALKDKFGWPYNWQAELEAATSPKVLRKISEKSIELISFRDL